MDESGSNLEVSLDEEEARLRERLSKIAQMKKLARELGISLGSAKAAEPIATEPQAFNGTLAGLIDCYRVDERSPYRNLKYRVRNNYDGMLNKIRSDFGHERIADLSAERVMAFYNRWADGGKIAMGHSLAAKLRLLSSFGATALNDRDCILFSGIMRTLRFPVSEARLVPMTAEDAKALRSKAHELGWASIALAQAIQFDLKLRQLDVIGEWVPISDPAPSTVIWGNEKWVRGLRWSDIDDKLILRFATHDRLRRKKSHEVDLTKLPMVLQELDAIGETPRNGPLIICEPTGRPYSAAEFRRKWRIVATKAGIPDNVRNSDSVRAESKVEFGLTDDRLKNTAG